MNVKLRREKIERLLARENLSQNWLAKRIEISSGYMTQLMNGVRYAPPRVRAKLQETFIDSTFNELFKIRNEGSRQRTLSWKDGASKKREVSHLVEFN